MTPRRGEKGSNRRVSASTRSSVTAAPSSQGPLITLLTDFGTTDYFAAAMKGVLLSNSPTARIVDITHTIPAHDIAAAAFTLLSVYKSFPAGTIHIAVVDPGVGSSRRAIVVEAADQIFIGPDNGCFSYIYEREPAFKVYKLRDAKSRPHAGATFHGRDVFAPTAALLANGASPSELGAEIRNPIRIEPLAPEQMKNGNVKARIIHIDHFGNCITNLTRDVLTPGKVEAGVRIQLNGRTIRSFRNFFAEEAKSEDSLFAFWGSAGFLELAVQNGSAAKILTARSGQQVTLKTTGPLGA